MSETKDTIAAERDRLLAENAALREQLAGQGRVYAPAHVFQLAEGERQELVEQGWTSKNGRIMTRDDVRAELTEDQADVELGDGEIRNLPPAALRDRKGVYGVDFIYPSVSPGKIDPAVAGTPGINGPAADATPDQVADNQTPAHD